MTHLWHLELTVKLLRKEAQAMCIPLSSAKPPADLPHTQPCVKHTDETMSTILAWPSRQDSAQSGILKQPRLTRRSAVQGALLCRVPGRMPCS